MAVDNLNALPDGNVSELLGPTISARTAHHPSILSIPDSPATLLVVFSPNRLIRPLVVPVGVIGGGVGVEHPAGLFRWHFEEGAQVFCAPPAPHKIYRKNELKIKIKITKIKFRLILRARASPALGAFSELD